MRTQRPVWETAERVSLCAKAPTGSGTRGRVGPIQPTVVLLEAVLLDYAIEAVRSIVYNVYHHSSGVYINAAGSVRNGGAFLSLCEGPTMARV